QTVPVPVHVAGGTPAAAEFLADVSACLTRAGGTRGARGQRALRAAVAMPVRVAGGAPSVLRLRGRLPTVHADAGRPHRPRALQRPLGAAVAAPVHVAGHAAPSAASLG